jgi:hypothetical protein
VAELLAVIHARRLDLVLMSPALMRAFVASDWERAGQLLGAEIPMEWRGEDWQWLARRPDQAEADPDDAAPDPRRQRRTAADRGG